MGHRGDIMRLPKVTKKLFTDTDAWTVDATYFAREMDDALKPVLKKWALKGYSLRELAFIAHTCVGDVQATLILMAEGRRLYPQEKNGS